MFQSAEAATLRAFITSPRRRERLIGVLTTKKRATELDALSHEDLWNSEHVVPLPPGQQDAHSVTTLLRERVAPATCRILGGRLDDQELALGDALQAVVGTLDACLVICTPGRLAYQESEEPGRRAVLSRPERSGTL